MAYYIFRIIPGPTDLVKNIEYLTEFEQYREARQFCRTQRAEQVPGSSDVYKMVFASTQLAAEEILHEKKEKPILRSWEK